MGTNLKTETVKGGNIVRDVRTGRFVEVRSDAGVNKPSAQTISVVKGVSEKHKDALKRLVNR